MSVPLVGLTVKPTVLHVVVVLLDITAVGLTVTVRLNGVPAHPPNPGVIRYVTVTGTLVVLSSDSFIPAITPLPAEFAIPATTVLVHAKDAPTVDDVDV